MPISTAHSCNVARRCCYALWLPLLAFFATAPAAAQADRSGTGEVISIIELTLKPGVEQAAFERFIEEEYNPAMEGAMPGVKGYVAKAIRGEAMRSYRLFFVYDSRKTLLAVSPAPGEVSAWFRPIWNDLSPVRQKLRNYVEVAPYTDYEVLR